MSIIKLNNKMISLGGKFTNLSGGIHGQVIWDGVNDRITLPSLPVITGNKKATFYLRINNDIPDFDTLYGIDAYIFSFDTPTQTNDQFMATIYSTPSSILLRMWTNSYTGYYEKAAEVISFKGQEVFVELTKTTSLPVSIKINGNAQTLVPSGMAGTTGQVFLGARTVNSTPVSLFLLRDIKLYDDPAGANTLTHWWKGYPAGNTNAAWADQVGSINGTVIGSPSITP